MKDAAGDDPELLAAGLVLTDEADTGPADGHGPLHQGLAIVDAGQPVQLGGQGWLVVMGFISWLPVAKQLGAVAHQLQHLVADGGRLQVFEAEDTKQLVLLKQGAIEA